MYRFEGLPPGRYLVAVNLMGLLSDDQPFPTIYHRLPGHAPTTVELGANAHAELAALRLPAPIPKRVLAGSVAWSDGRALTGVQVNVCGRPSARFGPFCRNLNLGADGGFSGEFFEGTYVVKATVADPRGRWDATTDQPIPPITISEVTVRLDRDHKDMKIVLERPPL